MHASAVALVAQALSLFASASSPYSPPCLLGGESAPVLLASLGVAGDPRDGRLAWELEMERGLKRTMAPRGKRPQSSPSGLPPGRVREGFLPLAAEVNGGRVDGVVLPAPETPGRLHLVLPDAAALVWVDDRLVPGEGRTREIELAVPARGRTVLVRAAWHTAGGLLMEERWVGLGHQKVTSVGLTGERARRLAP